MNKTYWLVTALHEIPVVGSLDDAIESAKNLAFFGVKVTILCDGNIVWVG